MSGERGPGKPRKLTAEQEAMVATLRRAGFGIATIAATFGVAPRTLNSILRREGVESSYGRRRLTVAQEVEVIDKWRAGWTHRAIAEYFQISRSTVHAYITETLRRTI